MECLEDFVPFAPPLIEDDELQAVVEVLKSGWISTGPRTKEFEENFKDYLGAQSALAVNSCTAALHLALKVLGVGPRDQVITTPMTFCATANVIEHLGATTILADVNPDTLLIDPIEIEKKISKQTKVILPVHYAGQAADMSAINELAESHKIKVVEDAAHCLPTMDQGKVIGAGDNLTAFSFYATKNITTAEGGMLTGPSHLIDQARMLSLHGMSRDAWKRFQKGGSWKYDVPEPGYKYNMTDVQAALGITQLSKLERMYGLREEQAKIYNTVFAQTDLLKPLALRPNTQHSHHLYVVQINLEKLKITRDEVIRKLSELNVGSSVHYIPIHHHSYYQKKYGWSGSSYPHASRSFDRMLSLPLSPAHSVATIKKVAGILKQILEENAC